MSRTRPRRRWGASEVVQKLASRYSGNAWAFLEQVRDSTGAGAARSADCVAISLWPSRGLRLHGFEVKVDRRDWQRELQQPEKADEIQRFCHHWWIAVSDPAIVLDGELPANWGLLVCEGRGLKCVKEAPLLTPLAPDIHLLCSILRRATQTWVTQAECERRVEEARESGFERGKASIVVADGDYEAAYRKLLTHVERFEKRSGVNLDQYKWEAAADAIKAITQATYREKAATVIRRAQESLADLAQQCGETLEALKTAPRLDEESELAP